MFQYMATTNLFLDCRKEDWVRILVDDAASAHAVSLLELGTCCITSRSYV